MQLESFNDSLDNRQTRQKMHKNRDDLKNIINYHDLIDIDRTSHPTMTEYIFFSNAYRIIAKINDMLDHKISLNKFQEIEILQGIFSDHNGLS